MTDLGVMLMRVSTAMSESFSTLRHLFRQTLIFCKHQNETIFDNASFCGEVFIKCHLF